MPAPSPDTYFQNARVQHNLRRYYSNTRAYKYNPQSVYQHTHLTAAQMRSTVSVACVHAASAIPQSSAHSSNRPLTRLTARASARERRLRMQKYRRESVLYLHRSPTRCTMNAFRTPRASDRTRWTRRAGAGARWRGTPRATGRAASS